MFKWPGTPSARPPEHELADYAELVCWKEGSTSMNALSADLGRLEENDYSCGVPEEEKIPQVVAEAYDEIERRKTACSDGYPFAIGKHGYALHSSHEVGNQKHVIYKYLLLATRLNMNSNREYVGIDGTHLFEELASEAAREYLGDRAESMVFGTAAGSNFQGKIDDLCKRIRDGDGFYRRSSALALDDKLDVVAWKHFADQLPEKLIAFGQCKTGTNYNDTLTQLQPDVFCRNWLLSPPALTPMRMFFIAEAVSRVAWDSVSNKAGLLFDRCRIVDFCSVISGDVLERVRAWTMAAAVENELPGRQRL